MLALFFLPPVLLFSKRQKKITACRASARPLKPLARRYGQLFLPQVYMIQRGKKKLVVNNAKAIISIGHFYSTSIQPNLKRR